MHFEFFTDDCVTGAVVGLAFIARDWLRCRARR
jgi:hypothetical protein